MLEVLWCMFYTLRKEFIQRQHLLVIRGSFQQELRYLETVDFLLLVLGLAIVVLSKCMMWCFQVIEMFLETRGTAIGDACGVSLTTNPTHDVYVNGDYVKKCLKCFLRCRGDKIMLAAISQFLTSSSLVLDFVGQEMSLK